MRKLYSIDFETDLISADAPFPRPVCMSVYNDHLGEVDLLVVGEHDVEGALRSILEECVEGRARLVNQYIAFDLRVAVTEWPSLEPLIVWAYENAAIGDPSLREKFLDLQEHGSVGFMPTPDRSFVEKRYSLADLVRWRFGEDISEGKTGPDSWRLRYSELRGVPLIDWPQEAVSYVLDDARWAALVWKEQRPDKAQRWPVETGVDSAEAINLRADYAHTAVTQRGIRLDPDYAQEAWEKAEADSAIENFPLLVEEGIVIPAVPPMPYKNNPSRYKNAVPEKTSKKALLANVIRAARKHDIRLELTDKGIENFQTQYGERKLSVPARHECFDEHPEWASTGKGTLETLASLADPIAQEMRDRNKVQKLVTSYFPGLTWDYGHGIAGKKALGYLRKTKTPPEGWAEETSDVRWADTIHPNFDILKDTGRSSSYGGDLYPSVNIQQADPRIRGCYIARPGYILVSIDYAALELFSAAVCWRDLLGSSVLYNLLREGQDPHAYLAAQISYTTDPKTPLTGNDPQGWYEQFVALKESDPDYYGKWRKLAKAVGLGFPGGLGIDTFVDFAWATYQVRVSRDQAAELREIWMLALPEAREWLREYVPNELLDETWSYTDDEGEQHIRYAYTSPRGMVRCNAVYTAAANGRALQSPAAEGFKTATWWVYCETLTETSPLYGSHILAPIHDEILLEVPIFEDYSLTHKAILHAQATMESAMSQVLTDIPIRTEAAAMYRWDKFAKTVYSSEGWLVPADPYLY